MILAIDTATQYASLALYRPDGIFAEESWLAGRNHTVELTPRLKRMLALANLEVAELTALAVALGPGSFTGLRIGLAVAKGLALPHRLPVIGVPTLEITAYPFRQSSLPVWAIAEAGRGRILAARYAQHDDGWQVSQPPYLTNFAELAPQIDSPALCVGEIDEAAAFTLQRESNQNAQVVSPAARLRRAGYLAEIATGRLAAADQDDPDALVPLYISSP
ncbi:MAG: tRNA (adenosine(37)-N6)-threonylcarbamoyltransferase complex dimerization subunit type 1 TsaB [Anaerolineae bacterium]|nr:tRNA (adenosine(37)-N6)-threonylcarbamoyltransferase complex dimerization subunit type 1 TsaB [Anaerolineae bacterium]